MNSLLYSKYAWIDRSLYFIYFKLREFELREAYYPGHSLLDKDVGWLDMETVILTHAKKFKVLAM